MRISLPTTPLASTHDTSRSIYHMSELSEFAVNLEEAANAVLPQPRRSESRYTHVEVVLMRWDDDNRLGVWCELEDLAKMFSNGYGFKTRTWLIPTGDPLMNVMSKTLDLIKEAGQEGKLLVVYYAGHAAMNDSREQVWFRCVSSATRISHTFVKLILTFNSELDEHKKEP